MPIDLILDGIVAILLAVTVAYCVVLDRSLRALRNGRDELRGLIENLDRATVGANFSVQELKKAGDTLGADLEAQIQKARKLADELGMMVESGDNIANRLEQNTLGGLPPRAAKDGASAQNPNGRPAIPRNEEMLKALKSAR
jgi:hypothetical protein